MSDSLIIARGLTKKFGDFVAVDDEDVREPTRPLIAPPLLANPPHPGSEGASGRAQIHSVVDHPCGTTLLAAL